MKSVTFFITILFSTLSFAQNGTVQFNIDQAKTKKSSVAIPAFQFQGSAADVAKYQYLGAEMYKVLSNNLTVSTYFQVIPASGYLEDSSKTTLKPISSDSKGFKWDSWIQLKIDFLIRGGYAIVNGQIEAEFYAYNVSKQSLILGKKYRGPLNASRKIVHTFSNDFFNELTGSPSFFTTRIVVSSDRGSGDFKEIYLMDWDGTNVEKITSHRSIALSPAWAPDGSRIAYTAFVSRAKSKERNADLFIYELNTGKRNLVSSKPGINSGANFSPDSRNLFLTISQGGNPDILKISLDGDVVSKLTQGPRGAMNVEPAVSPDGKKIAFSSDRSGRPMIYVMDVDGSNPVRLTFAGQFNATPSWSPDGKRLAFAGWDKDHFDVFTMNADGTDMIRITDSRKPNGKPANNEDPVFSPDGRVLMYTSNRSGSNQIYISDLQGTEERRITNDSSNYFKPRWSKNF